MAKNIDKQAIDSPEAAAVSKRQGVNLGRFLTCPGVDLMDGVERAYRPAVIAGEDGRVVFEQSGLSHRDVLVTHSKITEP